MDQSVGYSASVDTASNILNEIHQVYSVPFYEITYSDFYKLLTEKYGVKIEPYIFKNLWLNRHFAGTVRMGRHPIISYNDSLYQAEGRKHFTVCHEGSHYYRHKDDPDNEGEHYSDILENGKYSAQEKDEEAIADECASILMLNDYALEYHMRRLDNFYRVKEETGMSNKALFHRIADYLENVLQIPYSTAGFLAYKYQYGTGGYQTFLPFFITNFEQVNDWALDPFEDHDRTSFAELYDQRGWYDLPDVHWSQIKRIYNI